VKPKSKGILSIISVGLVVFSGVAVLAQSSGSSPAASASAGANRAALPHALDRIRQRLGEGNRDLVDIIKQKAKEKTQEAQNGYSPIFSVEDGIYLPRRRTADSAVPEIPQSMDADDFRPPPERVHISFSFPSAFVKPLRDKSVPEADDNPVASALTSPVTAYDRPGASERDLARSEGVARNIATLEDYVPAAAAPGQGTVKPNVIAPEPGTPLLFCLFAGALLLFFYRRVAVKRS